jgi:hypothetical protein
MNRKNQGRTRRERRQKQHVPSRWRTYSLMFVCALTLVCGFFFAARQHFSSMDFGMKNSRLRKQVDDLESEKRRLLLAREISLSPAEIKKAAKKTGLLNLPSAVESQIAQVVSTTKEKALPQAVSEAKTMVIKTASVSAVPPATTASYAKKEKSEKSTKTNGVNN